VSDQERERLLAEMDALIARYVASRIANEATTDRVPLSSVAYDAREPQAALRTILSNWISQGPKVREFEAAFAAYVGTRHGVAVNSGSSANLLALASAIEMGDLAPGDEVIVPATTFATVASPVIQVGCVPVYADVDPLTYNLDAGACDAAVGPRTRWIMAVHTLGYPADIPAIARVAERRGLKILEDCCEAHGAAIGDRKVGSFGTLATHSFFVAHNMTTGEGGMVLTNDDRYAKVNRSLREFGRLDQAAIDEGRFYTDDKLVDYDKRYIFERIGYNVRMTDVTASFGVEQLRKLDAMNAKRIANAAFYTRELARFASYVRPAKVPAGLTHTYYTYPLTVVPGSGVKRGELVRHLERDGIETRPIFAGCLPDQPGFRNQPGRVAGDLPNARMLRDNAFFIGVHPALTERQLGRVIESFGRFFGSR